mgnify:CR=1 FL=1
MTRIWDLENLREREVERTIVWKRGNKRGGVKEGRAFGKFNN